MKINEIWLQTAHLQDQTYFYQNVLGLELTDCTATSSTFCVGESILHFNLDATATSYHFAINIPSNKIHEAHMWAKSRVQILPDGDDEILDFRSWNAEAIYFYDKDHNIVELIARKNLKNDYNHTFGPKQFLEISEIGTATANIERLYNVFSQEAGLRIYDGSFERFCAIGDEHGLFICINKDIKKWIPNDDAAHASRFRLLMQQKASVFEVNYGNELLTVKKA